MGGWELDADDVLGLPVDELGLAILRDFISNQGWNAYNWVITAQQSWYPQRPEVGQALSEAWSWLLGRGLVARDFRQTGGDSVFATRAGLRALEDGLGEVKATDRLQIELHPRLEEKVRHTYLVGDYDTAVFKAFKEVEIRVRQLAGVPDSMIGTTLMQHAFRQEGPFWSSERDAGEQIARMDLFKGAIGFLKNPPSHREVEYSDPTEAAEAVLLADLLMRVLDRLEAEMSGLT